MPSPARSHAEDLRSRSDAELATLVRGRPDLARPVPADLGALAARAATRPSTHRALEHLGTGELHVLEAVLVAGSVAGAAALLGIPQRQIAGPLDRLRELALLWTSPEGPVAARAVGEVLAHPAGLGPAATTLGVRLPADLDAALAGLDAEERRVLDRLAWGPPRATFTSPAAAAVRDRLTAAGLMAPAEGDDAVLPREVALALRGGRLYREAALERPATAGTAVDPEQVDAAAGAAALELLEHVEQLGRAWETDPPRVLRSGGLAVRDHRALARLLDVGVEQAALVVEVAAAAGLVADDEELEPAWRLTRTWDEWREADPAGRWAALALAWRDSGRAPFLAGTNGAGVLGPELDWPPARSRRRDLLGVLAGLPPGVALDVAGVEEQLRWSHPLRLPAGAPTRAGELLAEAAWLGLTGRGALSEAGRQAAAGADAEQVAAALRAVLPAPVDHVLLQADLTAVAPGPLVDDLARFLHLAADVESRGGATVFRFSEAGVRRALDAGMDAAQVLARLAAASRTGVPQPLEYLVADVARRHGRVRLGGVGCYVRSDDEAALGALLADRSLAPLQLRRIAPTVLVSPLGAAIALELLGEHAVRPETSDGGLVLSAPAAPRARPPRTAVLPVATAGPPDQQAALELVRRLRSAQEDAAAQEAGRPGPQIPRSEPTVIVTALQDAAAERLAVWIGYVDELGAPRRALFRPERVSAGRAVGSVEGVPGPRSFTVHRITGVAPAD